MLITGELQVSRCMPAAILAAEFCKPERAMYCQTQAPLAAYQLLLITTPTVCHVSAVAHQLPHSPLLLLCVRQASTHRARILRLAAFTDQVVHRLAAELAPSIFGTLEAAVRVF